MKATELLQHTKHRSFNIPKRPWKFYQEWNKALFFHWEIEPKELESLLPQGLELDTINGKTWLSLVAFDMNNIGVRSVPKLPHISDFHEINLRTYVKRHGKPSVYFLSMEGSKRSSCSILKMISKFPYQHANIQRNDFSYHSQNTKQNNILEVEYRLGDYLNYKDETDIWLTERYAVFQDYRDNLIAYDVHHLEWPIQTLNVKKLKVHYPKFQMFLNTPPNRSHYSKGVQVLTWGKRKLPIAHS
ncbi:YqjF family protein [Mangrovimonas sp. TPBH4]|uniref:YqjF family protein n=1 Tax=Mangrovimonas sp. TPBH4 TaxID=1645914 RepID=UPI0006B4C164|nr:DUF2071 domain-containing protein [Mangrovimonas sp. TPBH4]